MLWAGGERSIGWNPGAYGATGGGGVNAPAAEADGFTGPLEVGRGRLTPTCYEAPATMHHARRQRDRDAVLRHRLLRHWLLPVARTGRRTNGPPNPPPHRGPMLKLSPAGEGFTPPTGGEGR